MIRTLAILFGIVILSACGHLSRRASPQAPPGRIYELLELAEDGTQTRAFPQYWQRNTLVIDMQTAAASGTFVLKPRRGQGWPMRVAFRVRPGSTGLIEVRAEQRMLIPVTREGTAPVDIELVPGVYTAKTEQMSVHWGP